MPSLHENELQLKQYYFWSRYYKLRLLILFNKILHQKIPMFFYYEYNGRSNYQPMFVIAALNLQRGTRVKYYIRENAY